VRRVRTRSETIALFTFHSVKVGCVSHGRPLFVPGLQTGGCMGEYGGKSDIAFNIEFAAALRPQFQTPLHFILPGLSTG
jgi:hypothetical protein